MLIYEVALSRVEIIERKCSICIRKWLILPHVKQLITVPGKRCLAAPTYFESLDTSWEGISTVLMIMDSSDPAIQDNQPDVNTGKKWKTEEETDRTISALRHQYIVGAVQMDRKGIGSGSLSLKQRGEKRSDGKRQRKLKLE